MKKIVLVFLAIVLIQGCAKCSEFALKQAHLQSEQMQRDGPIQREIEKQNQKFALFRTYRLARNLAYEYVNNKGKYNENYDDSSDNEPGEVYTAFDRPEERDILRTNKQILEELREIKEILRTK